MHKLLIFTIVLFFFNVPNHYGQSLYERSWGTLIPIKSRSVKPFSSVKAMVRTHMFVTEVHSKTGNLYLVNAEGDEIFEYSPDQPEPKLIYKIPNNEQQGYSQIESIKFDSESNLIISGRTANEDLATPGAYSESLIFGVASKPTFISKINLEGKLIWSTYFHDLIPNTSHLTIDADNNIYILNRRNKNTVAAPSFFQEGGDPNSTIDYQDVISKLDMNGKHLWSTFYTKDNSKIRSIVAGTNGLYIYGDHIGGSASSKYFGTANSHQESVFKVNSSTRNASSAFLSKFSFDGKRLWSTYFGDQNSNVVLGATLKNNNSLAVVGDEAYILTSHRVNPGKKESIATENAYLKEPPSNVITTTVSKFSPEGKRLWSSYIHAGEHLFSNGKELFITSSLINGNSRNDQLITTANAYQRKHGGEKLDVYTFILSLDGKTLEYASFYGYDGRDSGTTLPTENGFYIIGASDLNKKAKAPFVTSNAPENEYFENGNYYVGDFLSYFKRNKK